MRKGFFIVCSEMNIASLVLLYLKYIIYVSPVFGLIKVKLHSAFYPMASSF